MNKRKRIFGINSALGGTDFVGSDGSNGFGLDNSLGGTDFRVDAPDGEL